MTAMHAQGLSRAWMSLSPVASTAQRTIRTARTGITLLGKLSLFDALKGYAWMNPEAEMQAPSRGAPSLQQSERRP